MVVAILPGCCIFRKTQRTETVTVVNVDTVIQVRHDTIRIVGSVPLSDTVVIHTTTGTVTAYIDTTVQRIVATFTGKIFNAPTMIPVRTITITETPVKKRRGLRFEDKFLIAISFTMIMLFLFNRKNKT